MCQKDTINSVWQNIFESIFLESDMLCALTGDVWNQNSPNHFKQVSNSTWQEHVLMEDLEDFLLYLHKTHSHYLFC